MKKMYLLFCMTVILYYFHKSINTWTALWVSMVVVMFAHAKKICPPIRKGCSFKNNYVLGVGVFYNSSIVESVPVIVCKHMNRLILLLREPSPPGGHTKEIQSTVTLPLVCKTCNTFFCDWWFWKCDRCRIRGFCTRVGLAILESQSIDEYKK